MTRKPKWSNRLQKHNSSCPSGRLFRATLPVLPYLHQNANKIRLVRPETLLWPEAQPGRRAWLRLGPWAQAPGPCPAPAETHPAWGPRRAARHTTPLPVEPKWPVTAWPAARREQKGIFKRVHSTARLQLHPGRCGHQSSTELTFPEQGQQQKQQPQPHGAGRRLRHRRCTLRLRREGRFLGLGGSAAGCGAQHRPSWSGGRSEHCGHRASGRGLQGTLRSCARGSEHMTEEGRARAAHEARAGAGRGSEGGVVGGGGVAGGRGQGAEVKAGRRVPPQAIPGALTPGRGLVDQSRTRGAGRAGHE